MLVSLLETFFLILGILLFGGLVVFPRTGIGNLKAEITQTLASTCEIVQLSSKVFLFGADESEKSKLQSLQASTKQNFANLIRLQQLAKLELHYGKFSLVDFVDISKSLKRLLELLWIMIANNLVAEEIPALDMQPSREQVVAPVLPIVRLLSRTSISNIQEILSFISTGTFCIRYPNGTRNAQNISATDVSTE